MIFVVHVLVLLKRQAGILLSATFGYFVQNNIYNIYLQAHTYKHHCLKTRQKVMPINNLLKMLTGSKWHASPLVLKRTAEDVCSSTGRYCCPVWNRSSHAKKVDIIINEMPDNNWTSQSHTSSSSLWCHMLCSTLCKTECQRIHRQILTHFRRASLTLLSRITGNVAQHLSTDVNSFFRRK